MRNYLVLYYLTFFLFGNTLLSNIHHFSDHNHLNEFNECIECINLDNNNYLISDSLKFILNNYLNLLKYNYYSFILNNYRYKYLARAPPNLL